MGRVLVTAGKLGGAVAGTDDVAESVELRKEKVLAPGAESVVVIAPQAPGEYKFFDDFHQSARGVLVVK